MSSCTCLLLFDFLLQTFTDYVLGKDINFGFSQKSIIVLKKSIFSIIEFRCLPRMPRTALAADNYESAVRVPPLVATLVVGLLCRSL